MENQQENYKGQFISDLRPFLDMLENQHKEIELQSWLALVASLSSSVIKNPEQYLGKIIADQELSISIINEIFSEFLARLAPKMEDELMEVK